MFTVISYDVTDDRRRTLVLKYLKGYGTRVQYSVFECELTAEQLVTVRQALLDRIEPRTDSVRLYLLDSAAVGRIQILGLGQVSRDPRYYLIGQGGPEPG